MIRMHVDSGEMLRLLVAVALAGIPLAALAQSPSPTVARSRDGGIAYGRITAVDFQRCRIGVDADGRGHLDVSVMPSTSVQGKDPGYRSIIDLKSGQRVEIFLSVAGATYVAQIIRIR